MVWNVWLSECLKVNKIVKFILRLHDSYRQTPLVHFAWLFGNQTVLKIWWSTKRGNLYPVFRPPAQIVKATTGGLWGSSLLRECLLFTWGGREKWGGGLVTFVLLGRGGGYVRPPPYLPMGMWWHCPKDLWFMSLVNISFTEPTWWP